MGTAAAWTICHALPGRLRVAVPGLRANPSFAAWIGAAYRNLPGIRSVVPCTDSGRLLVEYDPRRLSLPWVARLLLNPAGPAEAAASTEPGLSPGRPPEPPPSPHGAVRGLSSAEAGRRLDRYGPNALAARPRPGFWRRLLDQFKDAMVMTLLAGAGISLATGRGRDALTISGILVLNAVVGASQAGKAEGSVDALRRMSAPRARVVRDDQPRMIRAEALVPGDLVVLEAGDKVPADLVIIGAADLQADESILTGESTPVSKQAAGREQRPPEGSGMLFAGATLTRGRCLALVTATGMSTEMGRIAELLGDASESRTPLQRRMEELGGTLVKGSLLICGGVVLLGLLRGRPLLEMFLTGVSLAVAAIPEGLPTFVTLGLATGVRFMARRKALVRKLQAVETLGSASVICSDKTGTLTANQMTVRQIYCGGRLFDVTGTGYSPAGSFLLQDRPVDPAEQPDLQRLLNVSVLCCDADVERTPGGWRAVGDSTEAAVLVAAAKAGTDSRAYRRAHRRVMEIPFDSVRRRMTVVVRGPAGATLCTKGAAEAVLPACTHVLLKGQILPLTGARRSEIMQAAENMAGRALRVLAAAGRPPSRPDDHVSEERLIFLGLFGMMDPPRPEVRPALARCRKAGIQVMMLTGDHPATAAAVAREIGLLRPGDLVLTGQELARMSERDLGRAVNRLRVCARVTPEQKLRIVRALRARGHVVAMTGDGVNDAPAVREADIGIAMGAAGTEVTKEAAGLILADDNFATIVAAVEQGRVTYNNIRKSIRYLLASNIGELVLMTAAVALGLPLPLIPLQLLWLNLVGDGLPALALGADPADGTEMDRPPRPRTESIFSGGLGTQIIRHGLALGGSALALYLWALRSGRALPVVRTLTLTSLIFGQLVYMARCRKRQTDAVAERAERNPLAGWAIFGSLALLAASVLLAPLRRMLQLAPLRPAEWAASGLAALAGNALLGAH